MEDDATVQESVGAGPEEKEGNPKMLNKMEF